MGWLGPLPPEQQKAYDEAFNAGMIEHARNQGLVVTARKPRALTQARLDYIRDNITMDDALIADHFGVAISTVRKLRHDFGLPKPRPQRKHECPYCRCKDQNEPATS